MIQIGNAYVDPIFGINLFFITTSVGVVIGYLLIKCLQLNVLEWSKHEDQ